MLESNFREIDNKIITMKINFHVPRRNTIDLTFFQINQITLIKILEELWFDQSLEQSTT